MKTVTLAADWDPKPGFKLGTKDIDGKLTYLGSKVWRNPRIEVVEKPVPVPGPTEVLLEVKACGICGSDVHMLQHDKDGYIYYPGLTAFPCTLGHEFAGMVVDSGKNAINKRTGARYEKGEAVCSEEMIWCATCRPCVDGYPNNCEQLQELGFSVDGAYARYIKVDARYLWSLEPLRERYGDDKVYTLGSLVEPTSVAYMAVIERGGGIRAGDHVLIMGSGPVGIAACAVLRRSGAASVIMSEPSAARRQMALSLGATHVIDPATTDVAEAVLDITKGMGAKLILEATGLPSVVWPVIEKVIWEGKQLNSTVVIVARADDRIPLNGEVFQVRRANVVGSQGHSGHGTFPRVIESMATGMDMTSMITKTISLDQVEENLIQLQTNRTDVKVTVIPE